MSKAGGKGGDKLQQKSPAEFFAENKNIAGFDNVSMHPQISVKANDGYMGLARAAAVLV